MSALVRDPVCGMEFTEDEAAALGAEVLVRGGSKLYFCSPFCRKEHEARESAGKV